MRSRISSLICCVLLLFPSVALAEDTWTAVAPGIDQLHRTTTAPQDFHVVLVELTRSEIWLRATGPGENGRRTSVFAANVGATVAINGDLWDANNWAAYEPLGLAVGDGWKWRDDTDVWSFFACDPTKQCWFDPWGHLSEYSPRWWNAVGGMQDLLVIDGVPQSYSTSFHAERHPRTAIGLSQDGATLILLVVDGRRPDALGMNFAELTAVMVEFGAWNAMNNDGGGSSTLFASGSVQNVPSDGSERVVANHLGIMVSDHTDPVCQGVENSRLCIDETQLRTCTGGLDRGTGDCAVYGLTCEEDGLFAYCVDPRCVNGGQQSLCLDDTRIGICEDGVYREGDCAGFGLPCVEGFGTAWCYADFRQAQPVDSSLGAPQGGALSVSTGEEPTVWFELLNTGLVTWTAGVTKLAPIPRDVESPFAGPDWLAPHRIATLAADVAPGERGRFTFTLAPSGPGDYELSFGLLDEGVTWFADPPAGGGPADDVLHVTLHVVDASGVDAGVVDDVDAGPDDPDPTDDGGCGCRAGGGAAGELPVLLLLLCWLWCRRRSKRLLVARLALLLVTTGLPACSGDTPGGDAGVAGDATGLVADAAVAADASSPQDAASQAWVEILAPADQAEVDNPVELRWTAGADVHWVSLEADGWPLHPEPLAADLGSHTYTFSGVNFERHVVLTGFDADLAPIATDDVRFTPLGPALVFPIADEPTLILSQFDSPGSTASFGAARSGGRLHAGCDLYWTHDGGSAYQSSYYQYNNDTEIYAVADGTITDYYYFYQGTNALVVDHVDFTVRYGEVDDTGLPGGLTIGSPVTAGQHIAWMGDLDMSSGTWSMLHFELFSNDLTGSLTDSSNGSYLNVPDGNYQRRGDLMDCGPWLRAILQ